MRTPRSSTGHTSRRPSWNIRNISAVQRPMPRTSVSSRTISSSDRRATRSSSTSPASTFSARSRIDAALFAERPAARKFVDREREHRLGRRRTVERGLEPAVDRARRRARQLLVADRPHQLGEMGPPRAAPAEIGGPGRLDDGAEPGLLARQRGGSLDDRSARHARTVAGGRPVVCPPCPENFSVCPRAPSRSPSHSPDVVEAVAARRSARSPVDNTRRRQDVPIPAYVIVHRDREASGHEGRGVRLAPVGAAVEPTRQPVALRPRRADVDGAPGVPREGADRRVGEGAAPRAPERQHRMDQERPTSPSRRTRTTSTSPSARTPSP